MKRLLITLFLSVIGLNMVAKAQSGCKHILFENVFAELVKERPTTRYKEFPNDKEEFHRLGKMWLRDLRRYCKTDIFDKASSWKCARPNYTLFSVYFDNDQDLEKAIKALQTLPMGYNKANTVVIPKNEKISNASVRIQHNQHELLILSRTDEGAPNNQDVLFQQFKNIQGTGVVDPNRKY